MFRSGSCRTHSGGVGNFLNRITGVRLVGDVSHLLAAEEAWENHHMHGTHAASSPDGSSCLGWWIIYGDGAHGCLAYGSSLVERKGATWRRCCEALWEPSLQPHPASSGLRQSQNSLEAVGKEGTLETDGEGKWSHCISCTVPWRPAIIPRLRSHGWVNYLEAL